MAEEKTIKSTEENPAAENSAAAVFEDEYESVTIRENGAGRGRAGGGRRTA